MQMISTVKIVIWDLDDTFWEGTLSEGEVFPKNENLEIVKTLVDRGIMNSIVSKNDYKKAMSVLSQWKMDYYFVFPQISWDPKGGKSKMVIKYNEFACRKRDFYR